MIYPKALENWSYLVNIRIYDLFTTDSIAGSSPFTHYDSGLDGKFNILPNRFDSYQLEKQIKLDLLEMTR